MPGPASAGLFLYAKDLERLAAFYEAVLAMTRVSATHELVVLEAQGVQLVVHAIPKEIAATITITSPPARRADVPMKFFFTVPNILGLQPLMTALGGRLDAEEWEGPGFRVRNACDPEGNVFQLRSAR